MDKKLVTCSPFMLVMGYEVKSGVENRAARGKVKSKKKNNE